MLASNYSLLICVSLSVIAVLLIGVSKAGFGGGVGLLSTPLLTLIFPAKTVVGFLLPLLIIADWFTIYHHRGHWDWRNLRLLVPGAFLGIILGTAVIDHVSDDRLKQVIGSVVILFAIYQFIRSKFKDVSDSFKPGRWQGVFFGLAAGFISAIAHSAGAIIALFLLPQNLGKRAYVSTMVLFFAIVNLLKLGPYFSIDLITMETLKANLLFIPIIPIGTLTGAWLNKKMSQEAFTSVIYVIVFITGIQLLLGQNVISLFFSK